MTQIQQDQDTPKMTTSPQQRDQPASPTPRQIFREHALQHYIQKNEESVLPKTISPFVFACCWIVLVLTILIGFLIWLIPVPNYLDTLGVAQELPVSTTQTTSILALFPLSAQAYIRSGQIVQVGTNPSEVTLAGHITHVDTQHLSATELGQRYALEPEIVQLLPSTAVFVGTITTSKAIPLQQGRSVRVIVRYQQGTRQALSLLLSSP
jgi:hypothetical protein